MVREIAARRRRRAGAGGVPGAVPPGRAVPRRHPAAAAARPGRPVAALHRRRLGPGAGLAAGAHRHRPGPRAGARRPAGADLEGRGAHRRPRLRQELHRPVDRRAGRREEGQGHCWSPPTGRAAKRLAGADRAPRGHRAPAAATAARRGRRLRPGQPARRRPARRRRGVHARPASWPTSWSRRSRRARTCCWSATSTSCPRVGAGEVLRDLLAAGSHPPGAADPGVPPGRRVRGGHQRPPDQRRPAARPRRPAGLLPVRLRRHRGDRRADRRRRLHPDPRPVRPRPAPRHPGPRPDAPRPGRRRRPQHPAAAAAHPAAARANPSGGSAGGSSGSATRSPRSATTTTRARPASSTAPSASSPRSTPEEQTLTVRTDEDENHRLRVRRARRAGPRVRDDHPPLPGLASIPPSSSR